MTQQAALRYAALGDSYTIGTSVRVADRWPDRLVRALAATPHPLRLVANLAVNGSTSADVLERELPQLARFEPQFASLLVGVNDVVRGVPIDDYRANVDGILAGLLRRLPAGRIITVSTPDYTVTPQGAAYGDPAARRAAILEHNAVLARAAGSHGIAIVDIHDLSLRAAGDRTLVAGDGLHPSGAQYALWVERIAPVVARLLGG
jgi:lysophospholipase L1-like esterase